MGRVKVMLLQYTSFTSYVINRVETDSKSPNFVWVVDLATSSRLLNSVPVFISKNCIVVGVESRTCGGGKKNCNIQQVLCLYALCVITVTAYFETPA